MTDRITAAQEFAWLTDRGEHRKPIDAFFDGALADIERDAYGTVGGDPKVLELGPGPLTDISGRLASAGFRIEMADTRPASHDVTALEPLWSNEQRLPYRDAAFTDVLAREVFEHVFALHRMIAEVHRVLAPGGALWFSTPFMYLLHDYEDELGGDFWRLSPKGWRRLLAEAGFADCEVTTPRHLWSNWQCPVTILGWAQK